MKTNRIMDEIRSIITPEMKMQMEMSVDWLINRRIVILNRFARIEPIQNSSEKSSSDDGFSIPASISASLMAAS